MIIKQCQFKGRDDNGNIFCQPLLGNGMEKTAAVSNNKLHPKVKDFVKAVRPTAHGIYVLVNALGAGEYWGSNVNGDLFPEKGLIHSPSDWSQLSPEQMKRVGEKWEYGYPTFMGAYPYKHHVNKDPSRAFGSVEIAVWNPTMHRVELVVYLDRALCKKFDAYDVVERIENGEFPDVSMGCKVPFDVCTICQHQSKTREDYCEHARSMMNKILPDGRKVAVKNDTPKFFDISFVFIGADKTAKVMAKLAGRELPINNTIPIIGNTATTQKVKTAASFEKSASQSKLSEIIKSIPAGPFTKDKLPRLERSEPDLPNNVLDEMGEKDLASSLSTAGMMGIVLKPREFQRIILISIGNRDLANDLDNDNLTFGHSKDIDDSIPIEAGLMDDRIKKVLMAFLGDRSIASSTLNKRTSNPSKKPKTEPRELNTPVLKKIADAYNGYRRNLIKKANVMKQTLASDPQLISGVFGDSLVEAFAGGIQKTSSVSVLSPDSLAYLTGAFYQNREFLLNSKDTQLGIIEAVA